MSDTTATLKLPAASNFFVQPDEKGRFLDLSLERIYGLANLGAILLVEQADGWRSGFEAILLEATVNDEPTLHQLPSSREEAVSLACERLISWCSGQKEQGGKKHKRQAEQLQDWALGLQKQMRVVAVDTSTQDDLISGVTVDAIRKTLDFGVLHAHANADLRTVPLSELHESSWNPRQYYPEAAMAELVASMRESGFREWLPLMVRPRTDGGYEIGAGHRRRRAAEIAGITAVPCIVREMSDAEFLDILNFDNTGREDVHPLHEASGWRAWMEKTGKGVLDIAARIGQSKEYVYQRLKYAALIPAAQRLFLDCKITAGHAILIARLEPEMQTRAIDEGCFERSWQRDEPHLVSTRELAAWIEEQNRGADLTEAPFERKDAELVAAAGACDTCEKRADDFCMDRPCYDGKVEAYVRKQAAAGLVAISTAYGSKEIPAGVVGPREFEELDADDAFLEGEEEESEVAEPAEAPCPFAEQAVVAHGSNRGDVMRICRNLECPVHGRRLKIDLERAAAGTAEKAKDFWTERAKALPAKIEWESRCAILRAVLAKPFEWKVPHEQLQLIALAMLPNSLTNEFLESLDLPSRAKYANGSAAAAAIEKNIRAPKGSPASDWLPRITLGLSLHETAKQFCWHKGAEMKRLIQASEVLGVDAAAITKKVSDRITSDFNARRDKARAKAKGAVPAKSPKAAEDRAPKVRPEAGTRQELVAKLPALNAPPAKVQKSPPVKKAGPKAKKLEPAKKPAPAKKAAAAKPHNSKLTPEARKRIAADQKKRWAEFRKQKAGKK